MPRSIVKKEIEILILFINPFNNKLWTSVNHLLITGFKMKFLALKFKHLLSFKFLYISAEKENGYIKIQYGFTAEPH